MCAISNSHPLVLRVAAHFLNNLYASNISEVQVALSGGIDSVTLLHILLQVTAIYPFKLTAIHINHGISPNSLSWQEHCSLLCEELCVPLIICQHKVARAGGESLENNARQIRYLEFTRSTAQVIALAHHSNDQVETMLGQMLRGSDLHNIAAMHQITHKHSKIFWRPLLDISRQDIIAYAHEFNLAHVHDESNQDKTYLRNFIRHEVLPILINRDNRVSDKLLGVVESLQHSLALIDEVALADLSGISVTDNTSQQLNIDINKLRELSDGRQINAVVQYIKQHNLPLPSKKQLSEFIYQALTSAWDKRPSLVLDSRATIVKHKSYIFISM